jgi:transitional endoplasmic reticulum ATPase
MTLKQAIKNLQAREQYLLEETVLKETFNAFPWDGAYALDKVMTRMFGWTEQQTVRSWFGDNPPQLIKVEISAGVFSDVPWGRVGIPKSKDGYMDLGVSAGRDGMLKFQVAATVLRKDEPIVTRIFNAIRAELAGASIYRGKAIKMNFTDDDGDALPLPIPEFLDTSKVRVEQLILTDDVMEAVHSSLFVPIQRVDDTIANGMRVKRGVLLGGTYGTGKSLIASVASRHATDNGVTFLYVGKAADLSRAIAFCKQYQTEKSAAVIFCEDVDRVTDGERNAELDELLNVFDGIDSKHWNIIVVMTTNHMENINPAMIRPGRLDACINIPPPDASAVERLIRYYGGDSIDEHTPLGQVGLLLAGNIPAVIEEVVKRSKLTQLALEPRGAHPRRQDDGDADRPAAEGSATGG